MHQIAQTILLVLILGFLIYVEQDVRHVWKVLIANQRIINENQKRFTTSESNAWTSEGNAWNNQNKQLLEIDAELKAIQKSTTR